MNYEHRQMRVKRDLGFSIFFKGQRYRPGDVIEIDVPEEHAASVEPMPEPPAAPAVKYAKPGKVIAPSAPPPPDVEVADPFAVRKKVK